MTEAAAGEASVGTAAGGLTRRDAYRTRVDAPVGVYVLDAMTGTPGWCRGHLRDLSASGAGIEALSLDARPGDEVLVRFHFEPERAAVTGVEPTFQLRGFVVRIVAGDARNVYGVRFVGTTAAQVDRLHALVLELTRRRQRVG
jgi:hypothetical protein